MMDYNYIEKNDRYELRANMHHTTNAAPVARCARSLWTPMFPPFPIYACCDGAAEITPWTRATRLGPRATNALFIWLSHRQVLFVARGRAQQHCRALSDLIQSQTRRCRQPSQAFCSAHPSVSFPAVPTRLASRASHPPHPRLRYPLSEQLGAER